MAAPRENQLERYDLLERIAVGGMAEVFLAKAYGAHGFEKKLAIKRILPELARDREFEERFISEAKLAVRLSHANVVQVLDFGRFDGTLFLAMEHVDGLDLAALLQRFHERGRQVPLQAAFHIAVEIARGLDFAHQHGVIHRDVSPSNILLSRAGEVKIADFGIAVPDAQEIRNPAGRRRIMGKWRYMSPEQTRGEDLQTRSDLFSAAAVMFELFTGDKLFPGDDPETITRNIHEMDIPSVAARRNGLPDRLDRVLREALAREPQRRPARAAEMQRALAEISYESSIVATALDVAEAVAEVLEPEETAPPEQHARRPLLLDDVIRQQLGAAAVVTERHTAVGAGAAAEGTPGGSGNSGEEAPRLRATRPATLVRTGVGADGVTEWNLGEAEGEQPANPGRAPPVGGIPGRPLVLLIVALATVALFSASFLRRQAAVLPPDAAAPADAAPPDAPAPVQAPLFVMSTPPGAEVRVDGQRLESPTPAVVHVRAGEPHRVELALEGYEPHVMEGVVVPAGEPGNVSATLVPIPARLQVRSRPGKATVRLDGHELGATPLDVRLPLDELQPGPEHVLTIRKQGYQTVTIRKLALGPGEEVRVQRDLAPVYGTIQIYVDKSWADIYRKGKKIGRAPVEDLRLPVGKHRLRLHNSVTGQEAVLEVTVDAEEQRYYRVEL